MKFTSKAIAIRKFIKKEIYAQSFFLGKHHLSSPGCSVDPKTVNNWLKITQRLSSTLIALDGLDFRDAAVDYHYGQVKDAVLEEIEESTRKQAEEIRLHSPQNSDSRQTRVLHIHVPEDTELDLLRRVESEFEMSLEDYKSHLKRQRLFLLPRF